MASACVNTVGISTENFLDRSSYSSYGWFSPRISFSCDFVDQGVNLAGEKPPPAKSPAENGPDKLDLEPSAIDFIDFEFRLDDPVTMLPADELFSNGKLVPLQLHVNRPAPEMTIPDEIPSPEFPKLCQKTEITCALTDPYVLSPKAPRCSSRLKELLGLRRLQISNPKPDFRKATSLPSKNSNPNPKSIKYFLHRNPNRRSSSMDSSMTLSLLKDASDSDPVSSSSRISLSSDHEDLSQLSLDKNPPRVRVLKHRSNDTSKARIGRSPIHQSSESGSIPARCESVNSPRMNSYGKIVFHSLERSSSSPSSFNGGFRGAKYRGIDRSHSSNIRVVMPVLNVPVCSKAVSGFGFGFGQFFSQQQKRDGPRNCSSRRRNDRL